MDTFSSLCLLYWIPIKLSVVCYLHCLTESLSPGTVRKSVALHEIDSERHSRITWADP